MKTSLLRNRPELADAAWDRVALSTLYAVRYGKTNPRRPGNIPVVGSSGVYAWTDSPLVEHPTVVVGRKGSAGRVWLLEAPSYPSDTTFYLEPRELASVDISFTYFALKHLRISASNDVIPSLQRHELENLELPIPLLLEQRAIAGVLAKVQAAVEAQDKIVATLKELKAATMAKLFREGLRGEPLKQTEIGEIPESWEIVQLGDVATIERGKFAHRPRNEPRFYGGTIPFIQTGDVAKCNGRIQAYTQTLNEEGLAISRLFPKGTIVLTIAANIADTGILEFDGAFPDSLVGITPNENTDPEFLELYLRTQKGEMNRLAPKGTQKNINIQFLRPWPVVRPPLDEQREIAHALRCIDECLERALEKLDTARTLFGSLLHLLMTGQVRVPVGARADSEMGASGRETTETDAGSGASTAAPGSLGRFVGELVERYRPDRVVLFGTHAEGSPKAPAEVGLLVIMPFEGRSLAQAVRIEREVAHDFALEVVAMRPEDVERAVEMGDPFVKGILERGRTLYVRPGPARRRETPPRAEPPPRHGAVSEETLREIVQRIVTAVAPEKIILFGSAARGEMGPDSDVDLLVIKSGADRRETAALLYRELAGIGVPKDIIVATPQDIERYGNTIGLIYRPALREGKVIYAA